MRQRPCTYPRRRVHNKVQPASPETYSPQDTQGGASKGKPMANLDVSVNDPLFMKVDKAFQQLPYIKCHKFFRHFAKLTQNMKQRAIFDVPSS